MQKDYWIIEKEIANLENKETANIYLKTIMSNKAKATVIKYRWVLEKFLMDCPKNLDELTPDDVKSWFDRTYGSKKARTKSLILHALKGFFSFCFDEEYISATLVKKRWIPKIEDSLPKYLSDQELAKVNLQAGKLPTRDRAIIEFFLSSGCRLSELVGLNVEDIDLEERTARVLGKGNKRRTVHFSLEAAALLKDYLEDRPYQSQALFLGKSQERLGRSGVSKICRDLGKKAGLQNTMSPHRLRHSFGTYMLARGATLKFIGDELGHNDLNTTRIYARIPSDKLRSEYRKRME